MAKGRVGGFGRSNKGNNPYGATKGAVRAGGGPAVRGGEGQKGLRKSVSQSVPAGAKKQFPHRPSGNPSI